MSVIPSTRLREAVLSRLTEALEQRRDLFQHRETFAQIGAAELRGGKLRVDARYISQAAQVGDAAVERHALRTSAMQGLGVAV